jgi:hypothetical protein
MPVVRVVFDARTKFTGVVSVDVLRIALSACQVQAPANGPQVQQSWVQKFLVGPLFGVIAQRHDVFGIHRLRRSRRGDLNTIALGFNVGL